MCCFKPVSSRCYKIACSAASMLEFVMVVLDLFAAVALFVALARHPFIVGELIAAGTFLPGTQCCLLFSFDAGETISKHKSITT